MMRRPTVTVRDTTEWIETVESGWNRLCEPDPVSFKAAISQRGVYDLSVFFGEGNAWRLVPYQFGGYPWQPEIRKLLDEQSPLLHVADITTPLLIKHGDIDLRTGVAQSELLFKSLKVLGKPAEYVRYPRGTHELSRTGDPKQRIDRLVRFDEFFQRFISKKEK